MKTTHETNDDIRKDFSTMRMDANNLEDLTVEKAKKAYRKRAAVIHPDKADPADLKQVAEFTAAFQDLGNSYQRILKYIIEKLKNQSEETDEPLNEEDIFAKENFDKFNFPFENTGSFTVLVEDNLADVWQECFECVYGAPQVVINKGVEGDRFWKIMFGQSGQNIELTVHFYNHNKPRAKKQSKILIQGANQSLICDYVFCELPKIYTMVTSKSAPCVLQLRKSKRKRLTTPVKKRNIKYKPAPKVEGQTCALCEFTSVSRSKVILHMKTKHTDVGQVVLDVPNVTRNINAKIFVEDMSVCGLSDSEELLLGNKSCDNCDFIAADEDGRNMHTDECHNLKTDLTLNEEVSNAPSFVKPLALYKCNECPFANTTTGALNEHKKNVHETARPDVQADIVVLHTIPPPIFKEEECLLSTTTADELKEDTREAHRVDNIRCERCDFIALDESTLATHIKDDHVEDLGTISNAEKCLPEKAVKCLPLFKCNECTFMTRTEQNLKQHKTKKHCQVHEEEFMKIPDKVVFMHTCISCEFKTNEYDDLREHIMEHKRSTNDLQEHSERNHSPQVPPVVKCTVCESVFLTELDYEWHYETEHESIKPLEVIMINCPKCNFNSTNRNDLDTHYQSIHMSPKVNIVTKEQTIVACEHCEYKCRLNIQLNNHMKVKHPIEAKYNCKECEYVTNYVANTWVHTLKEHPDKSLGLELKQDNVLLKLVAEQNADISEDMDMLRKEFKGAFEHFADTVGAALGKIQEEANEKCKTLAETVVKLHEKMTKSKTKTEGASNVKVKAAAAMKKGKVDKAKKSSNPNPLFKAASSAPSSTPTFKPTSSTFKPGPRVPDPTSSSSGTKPPTFLSKPKILYVADSVGHSASLRSVELQQGCKIKSARAFSSVYDDRARWPKHNFTDVVKSCFENPGRENIDVLVLSAPTVDITNMNTNTQQTASTMKCFQDNAKLSSRNIFALAERTLYDNPGLNKVIIMEHPPRFDCPNVDPYLAKPKLAKLANITFGQLWLNSPLQHKIVIGRHSLESSGNGDPHFARYQNSHTGRYDGVHFFSKSGRTDYTNSVKTIISMALSNPYLSTVDPGFGTSQPANHTGVNNQRNQYAPSIQVNNRFDVLNQGNF